MKNRKLNQLLVAGMISAAMMTSGISVQAADFSDDTSTVEEQSHYYCRRNSDNECGNRNLP